VKCCTKRFRGDAVNVTAGAIQDCRNGLLHLAPSPVTRLHRAIAVRYTAGARAALAELDDLAGTLGDYYLYHASRAELLRELGHPGQAQAADRRALELTANPAEQAVLRRRLAWSDMLVNNMLFANTRRPACGRDDGGCWA